jgi:cell division protein FtsA
MSPFFRRKTIQKQAETPDKNYLAIDIGTELLKILLFESSELGVKVKKVSRIQQQEKAMNKGVIKNLNTVIENCKLAINDITSELEGDEIPKKAVLGLAGEYVQGVSIIVNYERDEKFDEEVTEEEEKNIIRKVHQQIENTGKEDLAQRTGLLYEDIEILHITVTGMEIGGMPVNSLVGFRGKDVKLFFYASFAPKTYIESLKNLAQSLNLSITSIVSQPFAVARAFSGSRTKDFSGIFVDIGGGTTDVAIVHKGNVIDTQIFSFGGRVFTKEIARVMNLDYRHAELRKLKYSNGELQQNLQREIKEIMASTAKLWLKAFKASLEVVEDIDSFPTQIYLCGGGSMLGEIKNVIVEYPWTRVLPFAKSPRVNIFLPEKLEDVSDMSGDLTNPYDVTPAALAQFGHDKMTKPEVHYFNP